MKSLPRFTIPIVLLLLGVLVAGYAFFRIIERPGKEGADQDETNASSEVRPESCGDGVCQEVACLSTDCPEAETAENCPEDCGDASEATNDISRDNENADTNESADGGVTLNFAFKDQSQQEKQDCPVEEANLTPSDAVSIANDEGMEQGVQDVDVRFLKQAPPLDQCVWTVKSYESKSNGKEYSIVDATQEVYQKSTWKS